jgi:hypothetical protein
MTSPDHLPPPSLLRLKLTRLDSLLQTRLNHALHLVHTGPPRTDLAHTASESLLATEALTRLEAILTDLNLLSGRNSDETLLFLRLRRIEKRVERMAGEAALAMGREARARMAELVVAEVAAVVEELEGRIRGLAEAATRRVVTRRDPAVVAAEAVGRWIERSPYNTGKLGSSLPALMASPGSVSDGLALSVSESGGSNDDDRGGEDEELDEDERGEGGGAAGRDRIGPSALYDGPDFYALVSGKRAPAAVVEAESDEEDEGLSNRGPQNKHPTPSPRSPRSPSVVIHVPSPSSPSSKPKPVKQQRKKKPQALAKEKPAPVSPPPAGPLAPLRAAPRRLPSLQPEIPPLAELALPSSPACMVMRPGLARASLACGTGLGVHFVRVLRDPPSLSISCTVPTSGPCLAIAYSHDGAFACALSAAGQITLIDADVEAPVPGVTFPVQRGARALCMDASGSRIAVASGRTVLVLTSAGTTLAVCTYEATSPLLDLYAVAFCPAHPSALASAGDDGMVTVWQLPSSGHHTKPVPIDRLEGPPRGGGHRGRVTHLCFSPDGLIIHSVGQDKRLVSRLWQEDQILAAREAIHAEACSSLALLPDGSPATSGWDAQLRQWAEQEGEGGPERSIKNTHRGVTTGIAPLNMTLVATCGSDKFIRLWRW